ARYLFNDDGDVHKVHATDWQPCLEIMHLHSHVEATEQLLAQQMAPWDAQSQPPFKALIMQTGHDTVLGFVLHQILDQAFQEDHLYCQVLSA
ncbi:hypothetical protein, partial [Vibrio cholerae]|uniref:hypothetical protein n=1 Tax=Vibrio cholerae TaxID=666 RepID=UPI001C12749E